MGTSWNRPVSKSAADEEFLLGERLEEKRKKSKPTPKQECKALHPAWATWRCPFLGLSWLWPSGDEFLTSQFWEHMSFWPENCQGSSALISPRQSPVMSGFNFTGSRITLRCGDV